MAYVSATTSALVTALGFKSFMSTVCIIVDNNPQIILLLLLHNNDDEDF